MKIGDFPMVQRIMAARSATIATRDSGHLAVMINAVHQDQEIIAACRPVVHAILTQRILELNADLKALGVDV